MVVTVEYYCDRKNVTLTGKVLRIDFIYRTMRIDNQMLFFDDIIEALSDVFIEWEIKPIHHIFK